MSHHKQGVPYSPRKIAAAIRYALETSIAAAADVTGISAFCIRRHLLLAGHQPARRGKRSRAVANDHRRRLGALVAPRPPVVR